MGIVKSTLYALTAAYIGIAGMSIAGCAHSRSAKAPTGFTAEVRDALWDDRCGLERFAKGRSGDAFPKPAWVEGEDHGFYKQAELKGSQIDSFYKLIGKEAPQGVEKVTLLSKVEGGVPVKSWGIEVKVEANGSKRVERLPFGLCAYLFMNEGDLISKTYKLREQGVLDD